MVLISLLFLLMHHDAHFSLARIHILCVVLRCEITSSLGFLFIHVLLALKV
jgi:hypothetical protein